ncbi:PEP-CTERM sorting domain-containing protein [Actomonas aquatica]|uniref:PEP-CTERM sorting domain-containing protein n=1 Tax=Actomonas aquatica TaxID=2866162 RepID=A0ABZ1C1Y3_9BACT|nr:PEP-CTERM sorting domain-containing protein [Opitutus sp. WL0086]WRQ85661.1 PEP-CTERM sorting domain-containing protein [Opitutus sp. WL0086]
MASLAQAQFTTASGTGLTLIADSSNMPDFYNFTPEFGSVSVSNGQVAFAVDGWNKGVLLTSTSGGGAFTVIASDATDVPGATTGTKFSSFNGVTLHNGTVTFSGSGASFSSQGVFSGNGGALTTRLYYGDTPTNASGSLNGISTSSPGIGANGTILTTASTSGAQNLVTITSGGAQTVVLAPGDTIPDGNGYAGGTASTSGLSNARIVTTGDLALHTFASSGTQNGSSFTNRSGLMFTDLQSGDQSVFFANEMPRPGASGYPQINLTSFDMTSAGIAFTVRSADFQSDLYFSTDNVFGASDFLLSSDSSLDPDAPIDFSSIGSVAILGTGEIAFEGVTAGGEGLYAIDPVTGTLRTLLETGESINGDVVSGITFTGASADSSDFLVVLEFAASDPGLYALSGVGLSAVPEPSTYAALFGAGALGFAWWRRRRAGAASASAS